MIQFLTFLLCTTGLFVYPAVFYFFVTIDVLIYGQMCFPTFFSLFKIFMASLLALFFRMDFRAILPGFVKSTTEILIEIVLDLWIYLEDN